MAYSANVSVLSNNKLSLSGSLVSVTGSLVGTTVSGTIGQLTSLSASSVRVNNQYNLPTTDGDAGQVIVTNGSGQWSYTTIEAGSITPGGIDTSVQFKKGTAFSGSSQLTYDYNTGILSGTTAQFTNLTSSNISASTLVAGGSTYPTQTGSLGQTLFVGTNNVLEFNDPSLVIAVKNLESTTITKGTPLYVTASGVNGNIAGVYRADAGNTDRMPAACVANEDITADSDGLAILSGFINGVNTSGFNSGDEIYVANGGGYTNIRPTGTNKVQPLGYVEKVDATNGSGVVTGPGHFWELPNITAGHLWVGASNGVPTTVASSSFAKVGEANVFTQNNTFTTITASYIDVDKIVAREYHTEVVSASIIYQEGDTKFGNDLLDTHQFSGSVSISGSLQLEDAELVVSTIKGSTEQINLFTDTNYQITIGKDGLSTNKVAIESRNIVFDANEKINFVTNTIDATSTGTTFKLFESRTGQSELLKTCSAITIGGSSTSTNPTVSIGNSGKGTVTVKNNLSVLNDLAVTSTATISSTINANGGTLSTNKATFTLLNTTAGTINFGGAASNMNIGATNSGQTTIKNRLVVNGSTAGASTIAGNFAVDTNTLFVDSSSNEVGIGTSSPNAKLDVNGNAVVSGSLTVTGTVTELSTKRIKKNIRSMKSQLDTISKLNPVTYYRRDTEEKTKEYGFISEEVKEVYPEFVRNDGVNYSKMVSVLVSAVQELKEKVEEQQKEIKSLKKRIKE